MDAQADLCLCCLHITYARTLKIFPCHGSVDDYHFCLQVRILIGIYHVHLKEFFRVFPREHILVVKLEEYSNDPASAMGRIFQFLGLSRFTHFVLFCHFHVDIFSIISKTRVRVSNSWKFRTIIMTHIVSLAQIYLTLGRGLHFNLRLAPLAFY